MKSFLCLPHDGLRLVPATLELARAELRGGAALADLLGLAPPSVWPPPLTEDTLESTVHELADPARFPWHKWYLLVETAAGPELTGLAAYKSPPQDRRVELGYSVLPAWQGRGLATRAVGLMLGWCAGTGLVDRVCAQTLPDLTASIRVLEKNGFALQGPGWEPGAIHYERTL